MLYTDRHPNFSQVDGPEWEWEDDGSEEIETSLPLSVITNGRLDDYGNPTKKPVKKKTLKKIKIHVVCLECEKRFLTTSMLPSCPRCGGSDIDVR